MSPRRTSLLRTLGLAAGALALAAGCHSSSGTPSGSGGSSGGGGTGGVKPGCAAPEDLISDFTIDNGVSKVDGRQGGWYTYGDTSGRGTLDPAEGGGAIPDLTMGNPNCSGPGSLHVTSSGFRDWGSAMRADFVPKATGDAGNAAPGTYDASKYRGIAFWAKAAAPIPFVQVGLLDPYTENPTILSTADTCVYDSTMPLVNCSPYIVKFGYGYMGDALTDVMADYPKFISTQIDTTWKRFEILFSDMKQDRTNAGRKSPGDMLAATQLTSIAIQVNTDHNTSPPTSTDYEIWVDDVMFIK